MEQGWIARTVRPSITLGIAAVFLTFMALAWFGFGSGDAVKALVGGWVGSMVALIPSLMARVEYRITATGLERRRVRRQPAEYELLFAWDELERVSHTRTGLRYTRRLDARGPVDRFLKRHVLRRYSGEVHIDPGDAARVRGLIDRRIEGRPLVAG